MMRPEWTANGKALMCGGDRSEVDPCAVIKSNPLVTGRSDPLCAVTSAVTFHVEFFKKNCGLQNGERGGRERESFQVQTIHNGGLGVARARTPHHHATVRFPSHP